MQEIIKEEYLMGLLNKRNIWWITKVYICDIKEEYNFLIVTKTANIYKEIYCVTDANI